MKSISACVCLALAVTSAFTSAGVQPSVQAAADQPGRGAADTALKRASAGGKYAMLLRQLPVPNDVTDYGEFNDFGRWSGTEYAGQTDLPSGYWVYAKPYWYIWRDITSDRPEKRSWGPEQATGEPDTNQAGDIVTAWASRTADGAAEWLMVEFGELIVPSRIKIFETYNPGAVTRITAFDAAGSEIEVWKGRDTTASADGMGVLSVNPTRAFATNRLRIEIDSKAVPGWNEIDAVGMIGPDGKTRWATSAASSSTFAEWNSASSETDVDPQLRELEEQVQRLLEQIRQLRKRHVQPFPISISLGAASKPRR